MRKFNKKSQSQPVGRQDLSAQNISAGIGMGAGGTPIGEPRAIIGNRQKTNDPSLISRRGRKERREIPLRSPRETKNC